MSHVGRQALTYNEGFIYLMGGYDASSKSIAKGCLRYNIVTEKWQQLTHMLFEIMDGAACAINEYLIVVAGGVNSSRGNSDIVQLYDVRENQWRLFEVCLSSPRRQVTMVAS
jgi:N-acetylneuraminic acid mutarotase